MRTRLVLLWVAFIKWRMRRLDVRAERANRQFMVWQGRLWGIKRWAQAAAARAGEGNGDG